MEHDGCKGCACKDESVTGKHCMYCDGTKQGDMYKKETNADRIRSMSDEELAEFLIKSDCCLAKLGKVDCSESDECGICEKVIRNWLKSEVEE